MSCQICNEAPFKYKCPRCGLKYCSLKCYKSEKHQDPETTTAPQLKPLKHLPKVDDPELQKLLDSPEFVQYLKEPVIQLNIRIINEILNDVSITQEYNTEGRTEIATRKISNLRNKGLEQNAAFDEFCNLVLNLLDNENDNPVL
ncbi:hypothetical protein HPODL_05089 [Ogataea parapolymorpha DL-1]|uniref:HIT-type domain-containing protein n=1 Tax=Ogataea parapolymorpha (strain ATCC 26012 / BCRC 20466 / JCM 22074 / NRRL Y-7560 / DL-1) TaxID=871575 RepID=W1QLL0_OGAPD|nr:hypothetical protein HPODL_05089 [Ogataea parapolymorpha DL-1]ESX02729.1 hypothetical protein HPODL_05089 [Ogataea parapolymorpha DL-1]